MTSIKNQFIPPVISKNGIPGGWVQLDNNSPYVARSIKTLLDEISASTSIPANPQIIILAAASQVVAGIRVYLKFKINQMEMVVQSILFFPFADMGTNKNPKISFYSVDFAPTTHSK